MALSFSERMVIARRYSEAFFSYAKDKKALKPVEKDIQALLALWDGSDVFRRVVSSPVIGRAQLAKVLEKSLKPMKLSASTVRFCALLANHRRLGQLPIIADAFMELLRKERGEKKAVVASASPLNKAQLEMLETALSAALKGDILVEPEVNEDLMGGLTIKVESLLVDGSLQNKLERLRTSLHAAARVN